MKLSRALFATVVAAAVVGCGSEGCSGCVSEPIPSGFPKSHELKNALQMRVTSDGLEYVGDNFAQLVSKLAGGTTFNVPPSCSGDERLCCDGKACSVELDVKNATLEPKPASQLELSVDAEVRSTKMLFEIDIDLLVTTSTFWCEVDYDSTRGSHRTIGLDAMVNLGLDANNRLTIQRTASSIRDYGEICDDIDIDPVTTGGYIYCEGADLLCGLFDDTIKDAVRGPIESTVDDLLASLPKGQEARINAGTLLSYFAKAEGELDYLIWGGGYTAAENAGMSIGGLVGTRAAHDPCVPDCEKPGASCTAPPAGTIDRSYLFKQNERPDGQEYHVGIGLHKRALEQAAYGLYRSGSLCMKMDSSSIGALKYGLFSMLIPSMNDLKVASRGDPSIMIYLRPRNPPTVTLGMGTTHKNDKGDTVIDDPLVTLSAKELTGEVWAQIEDRWIRLMTIVGDLDLPFLLFANADGDLQPILGELGESFSNVRVEDADLLSESPDKLATLFPTLISVAGAALASGFEPIALPDIQGIRLLLGPGSITAVDGLQLLAIFADLGLTKTTSSGVPVPSPMVEAKAEIERVDVPSSEAFAVTHRASRQRPPTVTINLDARVPAELQGEAVEWTYRVDGGFYRPWVSRSMGPLGSAISGRSARRLVVSDVAFWLQGEHTIEIIARVVGKPLTADRTPIQLKVPIDTEPPTVRLVSTASGMRAEVSDLVTPAEQLELSWSIDGDTKTALGNKRTIVVDPDRYVELQVRDRAGNVGEAATLSMLTVSVAGAGGGEADSGSSGCALASTSNSSGSPLTIFIVLGLIFAVLRRRIKAASVL